MTTDTTPTHSAEVTLEPCPCCGADGHLIPHHFPATVRFYVQCEHCALKTGHFSTEAEAIAAWNTRSQPTDRADTAGALEAESAALRDMLREALQRQMEDDEVQDLPSSMARERGLVWLEGWFDFNCALTKDQTNG